MPRRNYSFTAICVSLLSGSHNLPIKKMLWSFLVTFAALALIVMGLNYGFANLLANAYQGGGIIAGLELSPSRMEMAGLIEGSPLVIG